MGKCVCVKEKNRMLGHLFFFYTLEIDDEKPGLIHQLT